MIRFRRMIRPVVFSGKGLHSGEPSTVTVEPDPWQDGVILDVEGHSSPLRNCSFSGTGRGTDVSLPGHGPCVKTVEHLFSALAGLGIFSFARIRVKGPEIPAVDGCASFFSWALEEGSSSFEAGAGSMVVLPWGLPFPVAVEDREREALLAAFPGEELGISYVIRYGGTPIGTMSSEYRPSRDDFRSHIAPARTFALSSEMEKLRARGLARGGSLENAILVEENQVLASGGLRFPDEFSRHKILDLLGDLYLLGRPLRARIVAIRAGHALHCRLVERLRKIRGSADSCAPSRNDAGTGTDK